MEEEIKALRERVRVLEAAANGLIAAMVQLGKEHHREVAFARQALAPTKGTPSAGQEKGA